MSLTSLLHDVGEPCPSRTEYYSPFLSESSCPLGGGTKLRLLTNTEACYFEPHTDPHLKAFTMLNPLCNGIAYRICGCHFSLPISSLPIRLILFFIYHSFKTLRLFSFLLSPPPPHLALNLNQISFLQSSMFFLTNLHLSSLLNACQFFFLCFRNYRMGTCVDALPSFPANQIKSQD